MDFSRIDVESNQIIMELLSLAGPSAEELITSSVFSEFLESYINSLSEENALVIEGLGPAIKSEEGRKAFVKLIIQLHKNTFTECLRLIDGLGAFADKSRTIGQFIDDLYDYWRSYDRYMILRSLPGSTFYERRPYRAFNVTVQAFQETMRGLFRDIQENLSGDHPSIYRQVIAGCNMGMIAVGCNTPLPAVYSDKLCPIPVLRQILINPPLILNPPMNKRAGNFVRIPENPLQKMELDPEKFLCFPAQVGPLSIHVYFHKRFIGLATSMANLFELASDEQLEKQPDAIFVYGAPPEVMATYGDIDTFFYDDELNGVLVGFVPLEDRFGYFGYVKKMVLTLHNIAMMKRGRMPFHGAMSRIHLSNGKTANLLLIGDTATGKSETLEALRLMGREHIRGLTIIADDMGSLAITADRQVVGYGTETGAFIRLDDLQAGYAFGQIDRAIIMSPHQVNARVILPVTTLDEVLHGYPVDYLLYANNYEKVDDQHPLIQPFDSAEQALEVFTAGAAMSKGTTASTGLNRSYFANIFGPPAYRDIHDDLARKTFSAAMESGAFIGQMRTRLGIPGFESKGPAEASRALLEILNR